MYLVTDPSHTSSTNLMVRKKRNDERLGGKWKITTVQEMEPYLALGPERLIGYCCHHARLAAWRPTFVKKIT